MSHPHILIPSSWVIDEIIVAYPDLHDYPWIKSDEHLKRINRYRKRVGQEILRFSDEDMAELILLNRGE